MYAQSYVRTHVCTVYMYVCVYGGNLFLYIHLKKAPLGSKRLVDLETVYHVCYMRSKNLPPLHTIRGGEPHTYVCTACNRCGTQTQQSRHRARRNATAQLAMHAYSNQVATHIHFIKRGKEHLNFLCSMNYQTQVVLKMQ